MDFKSLSSYTYPDRAKEKLIYMATDSQPLLLKNNYVVLSAPMLDECMDEMDDMDESVILQCPKCGKKYPESEVLCMDCLERLRPVESVNVCELELDPAFNVKGKYAFESFEDILSTENLQKISSNDFDVDLIIKNIKRTAFKRIRDAIKKNDIDFDSLSVLDKVLLFSKAFVGVEYKSYGQELGCYRFNRIYIDDRQIDALMITTLLHELTHFLMKEIFTQLLCKIWECSKNTLIESLATFILSYSPVTGLVDEYAAHTVEGRFTLYGFQDYSSFLSIQNSVDLDKQDIEMLKTIGNTFANRIKRMFESFIDKDMLEDIKDIFRSQILDSPDYSNLAHENCTLLNEEGFSQAIRFLLSDGFGVAAQNIPKLKSYDEMWP